MPQELLVTEPRSIALADYEEEPLARNQVRAEAVVSGISHGTELALYRSVSPFDGKRFDTELRLFVEEAPTQTYPMRLGYEWVGRVVEAGADVADLVPGDLVHLALPHRQTHTVAIDDGPSAPWTLLPGDLDPERASVLQSATIALQAIHDARLELGYTVAVFGLGAFGLLAVQLARLSGAAWIAGVDPVASRRELATRFGADLVLDPSACDPGREITLAAGQTGADVAIEFSGRYSALHQALRSVRLAGTVVAAGFYTGGAGDDLRLGEEWHHNRLTLLSSMSGWGAPQREPGWDRQRLRAAALDLLAYQRLEVDVLVTHRIPFARAPEAYELIDRSPEHVLRVVLTYG
jgi:2-desacetyl-2-hydroxyethyl bacteriochlorophyllide A dehydrogenase